MRIEETKLATGKDTFKIIADNGKILKRKSDGMEFGEELTLGYTYYIGGEKLAEPHFEVPEDYVDVLQQEIVEAIKSKVAELEEYDKSNAVNEFFINGNPMWVDVDLRNKLRNVISVEKSKGMESFTEWNNGIPFTFSCDMWEYLLTEVEHYAYQCLNVTEQHKANINALTDVDSVLAYDFTVGYPRKLTFNV